MNFMNKELLVGLVLIAGHQCLSTAQTMSLGMGLKLPWKQPRIVKKLLFKNARKHSQPAISGKNVNQKCNKRRLCKHRIT